MRYLLLIVVGLGLWWQRVSLEFVLLEFSRIVSPYIPESWFVTRDQVILTPGFISLMSMMILGVLICWLRYRWRS